TSTAPEAKKTAAAASWGGSARRCGGAEDGTGGETVFTSATLAAGARPGAHGPARRIGELTGCVGPGNSVSAGRLLTRIGERPDRPARCRRGSRATRSGDRL